MAGLPAAKTWVYRLTKVFIRQVLYRYFQIQIEGAAYLDTPGRLIIAPVHRSNLDSPLIAAAANRRLRFLAKASLFASPPVAWYLRALGAYEVRRGAPDRDALRASIGLIEAGEPVLVFPEGTRQTGPKVTEVFGGVAYLASKTGASVVPVGVAGTEAAMPKGAWFFRPAPVALVVGPPIPAPASSRMSKRERQAFSDELARQLQRAFDRANRLIA